MSTKHSVSIAELDDHEDKIYIFFIADAVQVVEDVHDELRYVFENANVLVYPVDEVRGANVEIVEADHQELKEVAEYYDFMEDMNDGTV